MRDEDDQQSLCILFLFFCDRANLLENKTVVKGRRKSNKKKTKGKTISKLKSLDFPFFIHHIHLWSEIEEVVENEPPAEYGGNYDSVIPIQTEDMVESEPLAEYESDIGSTYLKSAVEKVGPYLLLFLYSIFI